MKRSDAICAIRELEEETGIQKSEYRILPGVRRAQRFVSDGVCYDCTYYVAVANPRLAASPACPLVKDLADMHEVSEVRWHDIERIRMLEGSSPQLEALVAPAFTLAKKYYRGRWGHRVLTRA